MTAVIVKIPRRWTASEADRAMGPSIFTAFREQLKLKSESQKGPFEIFESNVLKGLQKALGRDHFYGMCVFRP